MLDSFVSRFDSKTRENKQKTQNYAQLRRDNPILANIPVLIDKMNFPPLISIHDSISLPAARILVG